MKRGFLIATLASVLTAGCYTGEEEPAPPLPGQDTSHSITTNVATGALVYEDWLALSAGGSGVPLPDEPKSVYVRCSACHGWDRLGEQGGFARQLRSADQPNAGYGDVLNSVSRRIDSTSIGTEQILHTGTGRLWSQGSASWDDTAVGYATGNMHPDFSQGGGLSVQQRADLNSFLNDTSATWNQVFSAINPATTPVGYTLVNTAVSATAAQYGEGFYQINCVSCHANPADLATLLATDGGHSKFLFRTLWGSAGAAAKTRAAMGSPTAWYTASLMSYINKFVPGDAVAGSTLWSGYDCFRCHDGSPQPKPSANNVYANLLYLNSNHRSNFIGQLRYLTEQEVANLRAHIRTL